MPIRKPPVLDPLQSHTAVSVRCKNLRKALGHPRSFSFAKKIGVSPQRWSNVEIGLPLSQDVAMRIVQAFPDVTLDYLFRGKEGGLPRYLLEALEESAPPPPSSSTAVKVAR